MVIRKVAPADRLTADYADGVWRSAAISRETTGNQVLFVAVSGSPAGAPSTPPHHHGDCETALYVLRGRMRFRFGPDLASSVEAGPGDFLAIEANTVHTEESLTPDEPIEMLIIRTKPPQATFVEP